MLGYAVRIGQSYGVWGGRPQRELRRLIALDRLGGTQVRTPGRHRNATKDRCEHGHRFDAANTYYTPTGERRCRICRRAVDRARERRRRQARQLARLAAERGALRAIDRSARPRLLAGLRSAPPAAAIQACPDCHGGWYRMAPSRRSIGRSVHPGGQFTNDLASDVDGTWAPPPVRRMD
jgi:hypothetical protein